ncbi:MAG: BCD family MFS transporter [Proteobacteria bacterium]|nr:BCD family MFS transporter [Pseudomonadota bacterium]
MATHALDRTQALGWGGIVRLGLVQAAIGAVVVLATSTINRIMVVELALPAVLPGLLVALHYAVQMVRPRFGHGSDVGGRLPVWIVGGMAVLALGGVGAAASVQLIAGSGVWGIVAAFVAFAVIGLGVGACGTSLLVLLAQRVEPARRAAAATITWVMMIAGFVVTTAVVSHVLTPYSAHRLLTVTLTVALVALGVTVLSVWGLVVPRASVVAPHPSERPTFRAALAEVWQEPVARRFALFVFVSMLAYSGQELVLEPFGGLVFLMTPAQSASLTALQHGGALVGMILVGLLASRRASGDGGRLAAWMTGGCIGSALALAGLVCAAFTGPGWPLRANTFVLGLANGVFAVSAIGSMMGLAAEGGPARQGLRMGLWGAAQAVAFALGGLLSSAAVDLTRAVSHSAFAAYALVFTAQALLFVVASRLCRASVDTHARANPEPGALAAGSSV